MLTQDLKRMFRVLLAMLVIAGGILGGAFYVKTGEAAVYPVQDPPTTETSIKNDPCLQFSDCLWDWQRHLRKVVGDHTITYLTGERVSVAASDVVVNVPRVAGVDYALYFLQLSRVCKQAYEDMGFRSDAGTPLGLYLSIDPASGDSGRCCHVSTDGIVSQTFTYASRASLEDEIRRANLPMTDFTALRCRGNHELAHWFTYRTNLDWFLNEGFAEYLEVSQVIPFNRDPHTCFSTGYQSNPPIFNPPFIPYQDLHILRLPYSERLPVELQLYRNGYCFWKRIEDVYGPQAVINSIEQIRTLPPRPFVNGFQSLLINIRDGIIPVVGDGFYRDLGGFGIYPQDFVDLRFSKGV